jgi:uncharacterized membrane protein YcfT
VNDSMGVEILPDDKVMVTAWGYGARKVDTGTFSGIVGSTPTVASAPSTPAACP